MRCGRIERIPGGTRQHDGQETGIMGATSARLAWIESDVVCVGALVCTTFFDPRSVCVLAACAPTQRRRAVKTKSPGHRAVCFALAMIPPPRVPWPRRRVAGQGLEQQPTARARPDGGVGAGACLALGVLRGGGHAAVNTWHGVHGRIPCK